MINIVLKTFLVGFILAILIIISPVIFGRCDESFLLSPCAWIQAVIFMYMIFIFYAVGELYLLHLYRKPKFYRSFLNILLSNLTFFTIFLFSGFLDIENITYPAPIFFIFIYPTTHLAYYWLFNSFLPKFNK